MKKLFYFTILTFMLIPFAVRAEVNLEELHNSISKDNEITIKSIPLEEYKKTDYFNDCMNRFYSPTEEICLTEIYGEIVTSKIKKQSEISESIGVWHQNCDLEKNTCEIGIRIGNDYENGVIKTYKINFEETEATKKPSKIKSNYSIYDLGYINQILNYGTLKSYFNEMQQSSKIFKIYPGLKEEFEKNTQFEFSVATTGGASGEFKHGAVAKLVIYYNDIAVDIVNISHLTRRILFVPDTTPKTKEAYIDVAEKRIKEYINDDDYEIKVEFNEVTNHEYCELFEEECIVNNVFKEGDEYSFEVYKLYLNGVEYELLLMPVPEKEIKKLTVKSKDYNSDISVETESSDVPLDMIIDTEDVTKNHKGYIKAYDIDLYSGLKDEYITKIKDGIIVKIPLPDEYDKEKVDIYHIKEDGKKGNKYEAKIEEIDGKKYAVFTTDHFSTYAIEEQVDVPNTYDGIGSSLFIGIVSLISLIGIIVYLKKKLVILNK